MVLFQVILNGGNLSRTIKVIPNISVAIFIFR